MRYRSLSGGVGGPWAAGGHGVNSGTSVFGHIVVSACPDNVVRSLPDENGALGARRHNELLVRGNGDL